MVTSFRQLGRVPGEASVVAKQGDVTYVVRVRRHQVEPSGGCLLGYPLWAFTRLRWQISGSQQWSVETTLMKRTGLPGQRVASKLFATHPDAVEFAERELDRLRSTPDE